MPCQLLHTITVCKSTYRRRKINVTPRRDCDALIDQLLSFKAPALDCTPRGEFCRWPRQSEALLTEQELAARLTRVPTHHPWKDVSDVYNHLIDERKDFPEAMELSVPPNIVSSDRPKMPFMSSDLSACGPMQGLVFKRRKDARGTGTVWLLADCKRRADKAKQRIWHAKAERALLKVPSTEQLLCVKCGENFVLRYGAGFVLCDTCEVAPVSEQSFDFKKVIALASYNRKDDGFQDEDNYKRTEPATLPVSLPELLGQLGRPLLDFELAIFLAAKHPGFTRRSSLAYLKAQRAAAQLSARFLFKRSFAEITRLIPHTTENAVRMYCERVHADFAKAVRACEGRFSEEASFALKSRMLDSLYAPSLIEGHQCHSKTCCTA